MEMTGGPILRAVLRQLSTAAAVRTLPTPCRALGQGAIRRQANRTEIRTPPLVDIFMGFHDGGVDAGLEVWNLDDGFALPSPLLGSYSEIGGGREYVEFGLMTPESMMSPSSLRTPSCFSAFGPCSPDSIIDNEISHQILVERLRAHPTLLPIAAAVIAGGRRISHVRHGPRGQDVKAGGGRIMRFRQQRRGPVRSSRSATSRQTQQHMPRDMRGR